MLGKDYSMTGERVGKEIEYHLQRKGDYRDAFALYQEVYQVQMKYLSRINFDLDFSSDGIRNSLKEGRFLLADTSLLIDHSLFKQILESICKAVNEKAPNSPEGLELLPENEIFKEENIDVFLKDIQLKSKIEMETYLEEKGLSETTGIDSEVISYAIFMALKPFYLSYMQRVREITDFKVWREGYCPVCGQRPMMAKLRENDGARILECWLCHTQWIFPRMECPFCKNNDQKTLRFFYVEGDIGYRVNVCDKCKRYIKTVNTAELERDVVLDVENIVTMRLDSLAQREGYKPADDIASIN